MHMVSDSVYSSIYQRKIFSTNVFSDESIQQKYIIFFQIMRTWQIYVGRIFPECFTVKLQEWLRSYWACLRWKLSVMCPVTGTLESWAQLSVRKTVAWGIRFALAHCVTTFNNPLAMRCIICLMLFLLTFVNPDPKHLSPVDITVTYISRYFPR